MVIKPYTDADALDMTWARLEKILKGIGLLKILSRGNQMSHEQRIALQRMRDEE